MKWKSCRKVLLASVAVGLFAVFATVSAKSIRSDEFRAKDSLKSARVVRRSGSDSSSLSDCDHSSSSSSDGSDGSESDSGHGCRHHSESDDEEDDDHTTAPTPTSTTRPTQPSGIQPARFSQDASGRQVAQVGSKSVAITPEGQAVELNSAGQPVQGGLGDRLNFQGSNWRVENDSRAATNLGNREFTIRPDGRIGEFDRNQRNVIPDRQFFVSDRQLFEVEGPRTQPDGQVNARTLDPNGQPSGQVQQFTLGPDGQVIEARSGTPGQPQPAVFRADSMGRPVATIGNRQIAISPEGNMMELNPQGGFIEGGGFGQNFNFGQAWNVQDTRAQAGLGARQFTVSSAGRLREFNPSDGNILGDTQFFATGGQPFQAISDVSPEGQVSVRQLDNNGQLFGSIRSFMIGPDGQVITQ